MDLWDTETTTEREHVPEWLVEWAQLWTSQSATNPKYREEYQQTRRLARASNVPPFVIILRMFRDTYQITPKTTREQFLKLMDKQIEADGGKMFMTLATVPSEEAQRAAYAEELEEQAAKIIALMRETVNDDDEEKFKAAAYECGAIQETWLVITQHMTPQKAHEVMVEFALNEVTHWMEARIPGPPPLIFERYRKQH